MLKFTSLALGLLSVMAISPKSEAMSANASPLSLQAPAGNLHSQVIIKLGGQPERHEGAEARRRREIELEREREAARRHHKYYSHHKSYDNHDKYRGEYRRDR
jgi:hypothetical protein